MTRRESEQFLERLVTVNAYFSRDPLPVAAQALYVQALSDLPIAQCLESLRLAVRECTFMPKASELRALVTAPDSAIEEAWMIWRRLASKEGHYVTVTVPRVLGETLIAVFGGWVEACTTDLSPEMWASKRKEFERVYRTLAARLGMTASEPVQLAGHCARENATRGLGPHVGLIETPKTFAPVMQGYVRASISHDDGDGRDERPEDQWHDGFVEPGDED
jgi:hypothetical protein